MTSHVIVAETYVFQKGLLFQDFSLVVQLLHISSRQEVLMV